MRGEAADVRLRSPTPHPLAGFESVKNHAQLREARPAPAPAAESASNVLPSPPCVGSATVDNVELEAVVPKRCEPSVGAEVWGSGVRCCAIKRRRVTVWAFGEPQCSVLSPPTSRSECLSCNPDYGPGRGIAVTPTVESQ